MSLNFGLEGVHVLITGAAGGIGLETVRTFRQLGARVTAHYNSKIGELADIPDIVSVQADVRDELAVERLFTEAGAKQGSPVSCLVVNHAVYPTENIPIADMEVSQWTNTLNVNLTGAFLLCKVYLRSLRIADDSTKATANIIFIGSTAGKFGEADHADYSASKAALMGGLLPSLKNEIVAIAPKGRVNSLNPGWVATPMATTILQDKPRVERILSTTPLQKVAQPVDVAQQIAVLASPVLSGHLTGVSLMCDGGMEGRLLFPPRS